MDGGGSRAALNAGKGALVGAAEVGVMWLGILAFIASVENAEDVDDALANTLLGLMIWLPLILVATVVVGVVLGWAVRLPMWGPVVPLANVGGVAALSLPGGTAVKLTAVVGVFALAGALAGLRADGAGRVTAS